MKKTFQKLYDKSLFDKYANAEDVIFVFHLPQDVDLTYQSK